MAAGDIIIRETQCGRRSWFLSDLSECAYSVTTQKGTQMYGVRLQPGSRVQSGKLNRWIYRKDFNELLLSNQIDEFCSRSRFIADALASLASENASVFSAARDLGVTTRTLQRRVQAETEKTPQFWVSLARARRAAKSLPGHKRLSDAAFAHGYSDQSHMIRELKFWFHATPRQVKYDSEILQLLNEPGYS